MVQLSMLTIGDKFMFPDGVGLWEVTEYLNDEKVICVEQQTNKKAWFWTNRVVILK